LFAKQLLHESTLPIEAVALASGFNAAKPMQSHLKQHTGLSPSQIRKAKSLSAHNHGETITVLLSYRPPYNWVYVRDFFKLRALHSNEIVEENSISKALDVEGRTVRFCAVHEAENNRFKVHFDLSDISVLKASIRLLRKMLDLDSDTVFIQQSIKQSGLPEDLLTHGIRLPSVINRFEAGCRAIIGQQVTVKAGYWANVNLLSGKMVMLMKHFTHLLGQSKWRMLICPS
jgi:AraC family transcriptional regulator of adaptative response / DNA-3-methyladenine glycosylase II